MNTPDESLRRIAAALEALLAEDGRLDNIASAIDGLTDMVETLDATVSGLSTRVGYIAGDISWFRDAYDMRPGVEDDQPVKVEVDPKWLPSKGAGRPSRILPEVKP